MTTTEASAEEDDNEDFNNENGGIGEGYMTCPMYQRQRWRRQRLDDRPDWIGNDNGVSVFLAIALLTVTLSRLCIVAVSFWFFSSDSFFSFTARKTISTAIMRKNLCTKCTLTLLMSPTHRIVKTLRVLIINKKLRKSLANKNGNEIII